MKHRHPETQDRAHDREHRSGPPTSIEIPAEHWRQGELETDAGDPMRPTNTRRNGGIRFGAIQRTLPKNAPARVMNDPDLEMTGERFSPTLAPRMSFYTRPISQVNNPLALFEKFFTMSGKRLARAGNSTT